MALIISVGCDSTSTTDSGEVQHFGVWGILDATQNEQVVRVVPGRRDRTDWAARPGEVLRASVQTIEVETQRTVTWTYERYAATASDEVVHLFRARFTPVMGFTYRIVVTGEGGQQSTAETTLPDFTADNPPQISAFTSGELFTADVFVDGPQRARAAVIYQPFVRAVNAGFQQVIVPYEDGEHDAAAGGWRFQWAPGRDAETLVAQSAPDTFTREILVPLRSYRMTLQVADAQWATLAPLDVWPLADGLPREEAVQLLEIDTVENGYGFFGFVGRYSHVQFEVDELNARLTPIIRAIVR
ncbi:MAG: hypothetical protein AAGJ10_12355 [Bacteroidota bacterium]